MKMIEITVPVVGSGVLNWNGTNSLYLFPEKVRAAISSRNSNFTTPKVRKHTQNKEEGIFLIDSPECVKSRLLEGANKQLVNTLAFQFGKNKTVDAARKAAWFPNLMFGYLMTGSATLKRTSPSIITPCESLEPLDFITEVKTARGMGDTSFFHQIVPSQSSFKMQFKIYIDLSELSFIPVSSHKNRPAIAGDTEIGNDKPVLQAFSEAMKKEHGIVLSPPQHYYKQTKIQGFNDISERGFLMSGGDLAILLTTLLEKLERYNVYTSKASRVVDVAGITVNGMDDLDDLDFAPKGKDQVISYLLNRFQSDYRPGQGTMLAELAAFYEKAQTKKEKKTKAAENEKES